MTSYFKYRAIDAKIQKILKYDKNIKAIKLCKSDYEILRSRMSAIQQRAYLDYVPYDDEIRVYCGDK